MKGQLIEENKPMAELTKKDRKEMAGMLRDILEILRQGAGPDDSDTEPPEDPPTVRLHLCRDVSKEAD